MKTHKLFYRVLTVVILSAALLPGPALAGVLAKGPATPVEPMLAPHHSPNSAAAPAPDRARVSAALRRTPLMFIENAGQFDERARFQVRGSDRTLWLAEDAIWVTVAKAVNVRLSFVGANPSPTLRPFDGASLDCARDRQGRLGSGQGSGQAPLPSTLPRTGAQILPPDNRSLLRWHWQRQLKFSGQGVGKVKSGFASIIAGLCDNLGER